MENLVKLGHLHSSKVPPRKTVPNYDCGRHPATTRSQEASLESRCAPSTPATALMDREGAEQGGRTTEADVPLTCEGSTGQLGVLSGAGVPPGSYCLGGCTGKSLSGRSRHRIFGFTGHQAAMSTQNSSSSHICNFSVKSAISSKTRFRRQL